MVGQSIGPKDGFLVSLEITTPPQGAYLIPDWSPATQRWTSAYLQLKGSRDVQSVFCYNPAQGGHVSNLLIGNQSLSYSGDLQILCVPRGAVFELNLVRRCCRQNVIA